MLDLLGLEIISTNETEEAELDSNAPSIDEIQEVTDSTDGDLSNTQGEQSNVAIFTVESLSLRVRCLQVAKVAVPHFNTFSINRKVLCTN